MFYQIDFLFSICENFQQEESDFGIGGGNGILTLGLGLLVTAIAAAYVTQLAKVMSFGYLFRLLTFVLPMFILSVQISFDNLLPIP